MKMHKIDIYIVGLGKQFADHHIKGLGNFENDIQIKAICDVSAEKIEQAIASINSTFRNIPDNIKTFLDFNAMIDSESKNKNASIKLCIISTFAEFHYEYCYKCLSSGFHVFIDKPIALTHIAGLKLQNTANRYKKEVVIGVQRRFEGIFDKLLTQAKHIGIIRKIHFHVHGNFKTYNPFYSENNIIPIGGGYHVIDTIVWLLDELFEGNDPIKFLSGVVQYNPDNPEYISGFSAQFLYNGPPNPFPISISSSNFSPKDSIDELLIITGEKGEVQYRRFKSPRDPEPGELFHLYFNEIDNQGKKEKINDGSEKADRSAPLKNLLEGLMKGRPIRSGINEVIETSRIIDEIINNSIKI